MTSSVKRVAIIVAGGSGLRMGSELPKQFLPLQGKPLLMHTLMRFHQHDPSIELIVALPANEHNRWHGYCNDLCFTVPHQVVAGGATRFHSVLNALDTLKEACLVAVHDGVRPFVSSIVIEHCYMQAELKNAVVPVVSPVDSLRHVGAQGSSAVPRDEYRLAQTPQVFDSTLLKAAYAQAYCNSFTDDASVVEAYGHAVHLVEGNRENIKITTPFDMLVAKAILDSMDQDSV